MSEIHENEKYFCPIPGKPVCLENECIKLGCKRIRDEFGVEKAWDVDPRDLKNFKEQGSETYD